MPLNGRILPRQVIESLLGVEDDTRMHKVIVGRGYNSVRRESCFDTHR